jgi:chorismate dehydratase
MSDRKNSRVRIGRIPYANLFPIFHALQEIARGRSYEFVEGVPSAVNKLLRDGDIHISPSSSIEYLRHEDDYGLLDGHSISSMGPIKSILLFSKKPLKTLDGLTILVSSQSETSVALLSVILKKFYNFKCPLKSSSAPLTEAMEHHSAYMLIGDDALREALRQSAFHIYDLGDIWYKSTGLPFVFALWMARNDFRSQEPLRFEEFRKDLDESKIKALKDLKGIARESSLITVMPESEIVSYWQGISYDFGDEHKKGLELFKKYATELKLL